MRSTASSPSPVPATSASVSKATLTAALRTSTTKASSERRANSAQGYAQGKGAAPSKLSMIGFGENRPVGETLRENRVVIPVASEPTRTVRDN